jgi:polyhydroxyalkanoate synthase
MNSGALNSDSMRNAMRDSLEIGARFAKGAEALSRIRDSEVDVGATPKTKVFRTDKVTLHHYDPLPGIKAVTEPVIIVYGLVGRYTMADLQEDRSLVRNLLSRGVDLYVVDWGAPSRADQYLTIDDYADGYLGDCIEHICEASALDSVTILGICEGGVFSTIYAALHPEKVKNLMLTITPVDFYGDREDTDPSHGLLNIWTRNLSDEDIDRMLEAYGNLTGEIMAGVFNLMTPVRTMTKYNVSLLDASEDEKKLLNYLRMEKWLADRPHHPGAAAKQWLIELYKENRLVEGSLRISGQTVDLKNLTMPVLNVFAMQDHIVPPPCAQALRDYIGTDDYTEIALPGGHVGVYVSSKSQGIVGDGVYSWLMDRQ